MLKSCAGSNCFICMLAAFIWHLIHEITFRFLFFVQKKQAYDPTMLYLCIQLLNQLLMKGGYCLSGMWCHWFSVCLYVLICRRKFLPPFSRLGHWPFQGFHSLFLFPLHFTCISVLLSLWPCLHSDSSSSDFTFCKLI